jgi:pyruvate dehydrogenase E1 component beta subunit
MIQQAIQCDDPVIFFEPKRRYWEKADVDTSDTGWWTPMDRGKVVRPGADATLLAYGPMVKTCLEAATAAEEDGRSLEVIDLRSLNPLDVPLVMDSARRTGRVVVVHEAPVNSGFGAELAARITEQCFYHLESPVLRVGGFSTPYPPSKLEEHYLPDLDRVLDAVDRAFGF